MEERVVLESVSKRLRVPLTTDEHIAKSQKMAAEVKDLDRMKVAHAEERRQMKESETYAQGRIMELREDVALGSEFRDVDCEWVAFWDLNEARLLRVDTGATVQTRPLSDHERQLQAFPLRSAVSDLEQYATEIEETVETTYPDGRVETTTSKRPGGAARRRPGKTASVVTDLDDDLPPAA